MLSCNFWKFLVDPGCESIKGGGGIFTDIHHRCPGMILDALEIEHCSSNSDDTRNNPDFLLLQFELRSLFDVPFEITKISALLQFGQRDPFQTG